MANVRLKKELHIVYHTDIFTVIAYSLKGLTCRMKFTGPDGSPYGGIDIVVDFIYPNEYPFRPPIIIFDPPLFHPNITITGTLAVDSLNGSYWSPASTTFSILMSILSLLYEPFICEENLKKNDKGKEELDEISNDECVNIEALKLWREDPDNYRQIILASNQI